MRLIVGLGNPGKTYTKTRHNIGWRVIDALCDNWAEQKKLHGLIGRRGDVLYLKPTTFMNESGVAVKAVMQFYKIALPDILIVYDDKDLPFGTLRYRTKGSSGGHNGMKSIIAHLGSEEFNRLRLGIAPATAERSMGDTADYVLGKFSKEEEQALPEIIKKIPTYLNVWAESNDSLH